MALIPPFSFNCVVGIGIRDSRDEINWIGTGTLVGRLFKKHLDQPDQYHIFIVTNKHVLASNDSLVVRFNPINNEPSRDFDIYLRNSFGEPLWKGHPDESIDIAALGIDADFLVEEGIKYDFFQLNNHVMTLGEMRQKGVSEGDFIYVLGFPLGILDANRQYVISRSGTIARLRDTLDGYSDDYMIDAMVFPGNSGGPVIYKPEIFSIEGTKHIAQAGLIGIIVSYLTYKETAVSQQTGLPRIMFEENSGLSIVLPMDFVIKTVEICFESMDIKEERSRSEDVVETH